jgi:RNase P subunit RPR2
MPDEHGRLTEADSDLIERWWGQHSKDQVICPVCKTADWKIAGHVVNIRTHAADPNVGNTPTHPHIIVTCKFCAHSMFFNAAQIGIAALEDKPSSRQPNAA